MRETLGFSIIEFFQGFFCSDGDIHAMAYLTLKNIFSGFFLRLRRWWRKSVDFDDFATIFTIKSYFSALEREVFTFFSEHGCVYKVRIRSGRHVRSVIKKR